jgi:hypothetical protein
MIQVLTRAACETSSNGTTNDKSWRKLTCYLLLGVLVVMGLICSQRQRIQADLLHDVRREVAALAGLCTLP